MRRFLLLFLLIVGSISGLKAGDDDPIVGTNALQSWSGKIYAPRFDLELANKSAIYIENNGKSRNYFYSMIGDDYFAFEYIAMPLKNKGWSKNIDYIVDKITQKQLPEGINLEGVGDVVITRGSEGGVKDRFTRCYIEGQAREELFFTVLDNGILVVKFSPKEGGQALFFKNRKYIYTLLGNILFHGIKPYNMFNLKK